MQKLQLRSAYKYRLRLQIGYTKQKRFQLMMKSSQRNGSGYVNGKFIPQFGSNVRKRPITDSDEPYRTDEYSGDGRRAKALTRRNISDTSWLSKQLKGRCTVQTMVSQLKFDELGRTCSPASLVMCAERESIQHGLKTTQQVRRDVSQRCIIVVKPS